MKSILITGASSGIGKAAAEVFLAAGWTVGLAARRQEALEAVAPGNPAAHVLPMDVTDPASVEAGFARFAGSAGDLDCLFNNAGIFTPAAPIDLIDPADWQMAVDVNLTGMFLCARAAFGRMRGRGGRIINNGSVSAHVPRPGAAPYTATKHAITGLTRQIALDGRDLGINAGQIDIGNAETDMLRSLGDALEAKGETRPPMMDVRHAAEAVLHMASLPPSANILFQTIMAPQMPYVGRG